MIVDSHPILTCAETAKLEQALFVGDEAKEWAAMQQAGHAVGDAVLEDFREIGPWPARARLLLLAGKGHNGGDAFIAAHRILSLHSCATVDVAFVFGERALRPLAAQAYRSLAHEAGERLKVIDPAAIGDAYDVCLDGVFGFQFRPPAPPQVKKLFERINQRPIRLRAAVDLPSAGLFRADFTYATGSVKAPVVDREAAGRVRYLDLGFFPTPAPARDRVLTPSILSPLAGLRPARHDKRTQGHVLVLGGSRNYPGAVLMSVLAALRSGVGLVTAFVPESLAPAYAARAPEAMWHGWPETPDGNLALEGRHLLQSKIERAQAMVIGPGLSREAETLALAKDLAKEIKLPLLLDADALQPDIVAARHGPMIVTPHAGEFARISGYKSPGKSSKNKPADHASEINEALRAFCQRSHAVVVLKGPVTRIGHATTIQHSFFGGPVLARGGSGDLLAGLIGGLLAQTPDDPLLAACRGTVWHGRAADLLAQSHGQTAVETTQLLDFLSPALRAIDDARKAFALE